MLQIRRFFSTPPRLRSLFCNTHVCVQTTALKNELFNLFPIGHNIPIWHSAIRELLLSSGNGDRKESDAEREKSYVFITIRRNVVIINYAIIRFRWPSILFFPDNINDSDGSSSSSMFEQQSANVDFPGIELDQHAMPIRCATDKINVL